MNDYTHQAQKQLPKGVKWEKVGFYEYEDRGGRLWVVRRREVAQYASGLPFINVNSGKQHKRYIEVWNGFSEKPDHAPPLLYNIKNVRKAVDDGTPIFIVEGEPKVDALFKWGYTATCNEGGAGKWTMGHADEVRGQKSDIIILPDNDQAGRDHADDIGRSLINAAQSCRLLELPGLPEHGDIIDWIKAGGTKEQLEQLVASATREWKPYGPPRKSTKEFETEVASDIEMEAVSWFWEKRIARRKVNVLFGPPETGKSNLGLYLVAKSTRGGEWPVDGYAPKGKWIVLSAEDDWADTIVPRLVANGADLDQVFRLKTAQRWFDLTHDLPALKTTIEKLGNVVGVFIDPATAYLSKPGKTDSHRQADVRAIMGPLGELAAERNLTIIIILHPNKETKVQSVLAWISGSTAFGEAPRLVQLVIPNPEGEGVLFLRAKNNNVPKSVETGLAFQLVSTEVVPGICVPKIVWENEPVTISAKDAVDAYVTANRLPRCATG
jgi:putative DNA primase/helicase